MKKELYQILALAIFVFFSIDYIETSWFRVGRSLQVSETKVGKLESGVRGFEGKGEGWNEAEKVEVDIDADIVVFNTKDKRRLEKRELASVCSDNQIYNGDAELGSTDGWHKHRDSTIGVVPGGYDGSFWAFKISNRIYGGMQGIFQLVTPTCLQDVGHTWSFQARIKMYDEVSNAGIECDPKSKDVNSCPYIHILVTNNNQHQHAFIFDTEMTWDPSGWNTFNVLYEPPAEVSGPGVNNFAVLFVGGPKNSVMELDDVDIRRLDNPPTFSPTASFSPSISPTTFCTKNFVRNNDMETGSTQYWSGYGSDIGVETGGFGNSTYALKSYNRTHSLVGILQSLDHSCVDVGSTWKFEFKTRLYNQVTGEAITSCNPKDTSSNDCPFIRLRTRKYGNRLFEDFKDTEMEWNPEGWSSYHYIVTLTDKNAGPQVDEFIPQFLGGPVGSVLLIDDVNIERLEKWETPTMSPTTTPVPTAAPSVYCNKNWAGNGDFEDGDISPWKGFGNPLTIESPGFGGSNGALKAYDRDKWTRGANIWSAIDTDCVEEGSVWRFEAKIKLYDQLTGEPISCDPTEKKCPFIRLLSRINNHNIWSLLYSTDMIWNGGNGTDSWSTLSIDYTVTSEHVGDGLQMFTPFFVGGPHMSVLLLDDARIERLDHMEIPTAAPTLSTIPSSSPTFFCTKNFVRNPDAELGSQYYWMGYGNPIEVTEKGGGYGNIGYALRSYNRNSWHRGLAQVLDYSCLEIGSTWRFQAKVKLYDQATEDGITTCDPSSESSLDCPMIRMLTQKYDKRHWDLFRDHEMSWNPSGWNTLDIIVTLTEENAGSDITWMLVVIVGGPKNSVLEVDDVSIERLEDWEIPTMMPTISSPPSQDPCSINLARNDKFEEGQQMWNGYGNPIRIDDEPGFGGNGSALQAYNRNSWHRGIGQWIEGYSCFSFNSTLHVQAKVKLLDQTSRAPITTCEPKNTLSDSCPMVRLLTKKKDGSHHWDLYRDTNMNWNPNGWSDLNIKVKLTTDNSGDDISQFRPFFVGGPSSSLLLIDDVQITLGDDTDIQPALPEPKFCRSTGDPHFKSFNGTKFDNHEVGWHTLYEYGKAKLEAEHKLFRPNGRVMINRAWRVSYDGQTVEEGERGVLPSNDGIIMLFDPTVKIEIRARDFSSFFEDGYIYDIFLTTPHYEFASGLCADRQVTNEVPEFPENPTVTVDAANNACAALVGTDNYEDCVADIRLLDNVDGINDIVAAAAAANVAETRTVETISQITKTDSASEAEDQALVEEEPPVEVERNVESSSQNIEVEDDESILQTTRSLEASVEAKGDAMKESQSGVNGDPLIIGLQNQAFNFHGKDETWYANIGTSVFQWNMKFHFFPECAEEDAMYVTSMAISVDKIDSRGGSNDILISVADENKVFPGCNAGSNLCLGDGSLQITVNGQTYDQPGDYKISDDLRIVAHNTWEACSRKWYDYSEAMHKRDITEFIDRRLGHIRRRAEMMMDKAPIDFLKDAREHMVSPLHCNDWIEHRANNEDLFMQLGGWSTIYIETPNASFHIEYRQIQKDQEGIHKGGGSGSTEDLIIDGVVFQGNAQKCQAHVLDAYLTHAAPDVRQEDWSGVLGETKTSKEGEDGNVVLNNRNILLMGSDEDYEVEYPFSKDFVAKVL